MSVIQLNPYTVKDNVSDFAITDYNGQVQLNKVRVQLNKQLQKLKDKFIQNNQQVKQLYQLNNQQFQSLQSCFQVNSKIDFKTKRQLIRAQKLILVNQRKYCCKCYQTFHCDRNCFSNHSCYYCKVLHQPYQYCNSYDCVKGVCAYLILCGWICCFIGSLCICCDWCYGKIDQCCCKEGQKQVQTLAGQLQKESYSQFMNPLTI